MLKSVQQLLEILDLRSRIHFALLLIPMVGVTIMEVISIGLILPVIQVLLPSQQDSQLTAVVFRYFPELAHSEKVLLMVCIFAVFFLTKNFLLLVMIYVINKVVALKTALYTSVLFRVYLSRSLLFHFHNNSALLLRNSTSGVGQSLGAIRIVLLLGLDLLLMIGALIFLLIIEPEATLGITILLLLFSFIFFKIGSPVFRRWGELSMDLEGSLIRWINQSFNGIRDVKLFNAAEYLFDRVGDIARDLADVESKMSTSHQVPRLLIETIVVIGFLGVILIFSSIARTPYEIIGTVGIFGMTALRLMPSLNRILTAATQLRQRAAFISTIHNDLQIVDKKFALFPESLPSQEQLPFDHQIDIDNIEFSYSPAERPVLEGVNLTIKKGETIGFVGSSGAGKSTLMDILLGFLMPKIGRVMIDENSVFDNIVGWQKRLGFVPQQVFVMDDNIRRNVAFAVEDELIDDERVSAVLEMAQLDTFVNDLPQGLDTVLGENGTRLSGGQRQRIAIARALYRDPDVLVFDEATSALDNVTELGITDALEKLSGEKTILIVAHRLSTVRKCDKIVFMKEGRVEAIGTYQELLSTNNEFGALAKLGDVATPKTRDQSK